jgi:hypothetical protein
VKFVVADVADPALASEIGEVALWHDRAVLHFLTEESQWRGYAENLRKAVRVGGHAILATFALDGAEMCNGLPVRRYGAEMLTELVRDSSWCDPWTTRITSRGVILGRTYTRCFVEWGSLRRLPRSRNY